MLTRIEDVLYDQCLLRKDLPILVGVSGGPDSLCLIHLLAQLGFKCLIAHVNHGLRIEAGAEARHVGGLANQLGFPFVSVEVDVRAYANRENLSIEEAARNLRYQFLFAQAIGTGAQAVAVGHTADDQVETVLMHLLRGSGLAGLKGMLFRSLPTQWSDEVPLVRPLLGTWRGQVMDYLDKYGYSPSIDPSNQELDFYRNRLRHVLLPFLENFNPHVRQNVWRTAEILREDDLIVKEVVERAWEACVLLKGTNYLVFSLHNLRHQSIGLQRYLFRRGIGLVRPNYRGLDFDTLQRALDFIDSPTRTRQIDLANGLRLILEEDRLILAGGEADLPVSDWPQLAGGTSGIFEMPGDFHLLEGWLFKGTLEPAIPESLKENFYNLDPYLVCIDSQGLMLPLTVRHRQPGDRMTPLGMGGHSIKLSDLMINLKMPKRARSGWPLVCGVREKDGCEEILWIPGYRQSHSYRITDKTHQILRLQLLKIRSK